MGPQLIWINITVGINVIFEEVFALRRIGHKISTMRVIVQTKM